MGRKKKVIEKAVEEIRAVIKEREEKPDYPELLDLIESIKKLSLGQLIVIKKEVDTQLSIARRNSASKMIHSK